MKTAELKVIIDKHTTSLADFEAIWGAVNKYMQSHPSPMSAEQVELLESSKIALHTLDCIEFTREQGTASKRLETAISNFSTTPSVKAESCT